MTRSDKPILMQPEMVRALIDGRKTQTRRIIKEPDNGVHTLIEDGVPLHFADYVDGLWHERPCPHGQPGELLWVREPHYLEKRPQCHNAVAYAADNEAIPTGSYIEGWTKLRPSIHMPRWANRITLLIKDIRVERVQDISETDAMAEGVYGQGKFWCNPLHPALCCFSARPAFPDLWDTINTQPGTRWRDNPWIWALQYTPYLMNIDNFKKQEAA